MNIFYAILFTFSADPSAIVLDNFDTFEKCQAVVETYPETDEQLAICVIKQPYEI